MFFSFYFFFQSVHSHFLVFTFPLFRFFPIVNRNTRVAKDHRQPFVKKHELFFLIKTFKQIDNTEFARSS